MNELEAELAALRAEVARLKTVPMKYRRMEFNAQLQQENASLRAERDALRERSEVWRVAYEGACKLVADMHTAAMGATVGPALGVVEDVAALRDENTKLKTVMIAAAEEIHTHWDAHCDAEGYGPQNLMRRLEEGIPSEYGYTAGAFAALQAERDALRRLFEDAVPGLIEVARMPNAEHVADAHNAAVCKLRARAAINTAKEQR